MGREGNHVAVVSDAAGVSSESAGRLGLCSERRAARHRADAMTRSLHRSTVTLAALERAHPAIRQRHQMAILREAERICFEDLIVNPKQPSKLHLYGLLAIRKGQREFARACLERAAAL